MHLEKRWGEFSFYTKFNTLHLPLNVHFPHLFYIPVPGYSQYHLSASQPALQGLPGRPSGSSQRRLTGERGRQGVPMRHSRPAHPGIYGMPFFF